MKNMKKQTQAFTLVELIVVITILAILGTIAFINLQWYSWSARDSKRESDISNILKKVSVEQIKWVTWWELIENQSTKPVIINEIATNAIQWTPKFSQLKEDWNSFKDPTKSDYILSYAKWWTSTWAYNFLQIATINEERNEAVVKWNYYMYNTVTDSPSIIKNASDLFVVDWWSQLPYEASNNLVTPIPASNILTLSRNMWGYNCALYSTLNIKCWWDNSAGQLWDWTTNSSLSPFIVQWL